MKREVGEKPKNAFSYIKNIKSIKQNSVRCLDHLPRLHACWHLYLQHLAVWGLELQLHSWNRRRWQLHCHHSLLLLLWSLRPLLLATGTGTIIVRWVVCHRRVHSDGILHALFHALARLHFNGPFLLFRLRFPCRGCSCPGPCSASSRGSGLGSIRPLAGFRALAAIRAIRHATYQQKAAENYCQQTNRPHGHRAAVTRQTP